MDLIVNNQFYKLLLINPEDNLSPSGWFNLYLTTMRHHKLIARGFFIYVDNSSENSFPGTVSVSILV